MATAAEEVVTTVNSKETGWVRAKAGWARAEAARRTASATVGVMALALAALLASATATAVTPTWLLCLSLVPTLERPPSQPAAAVARRTRGPGAGPTARRRAKSKTPRQTPRPAERGRPAGGPRGMPSSCATAGGRQERWPLLRRHNPYLWPLMLRLERTDRTRKERGCLLACVRAFAGQAGRSVESHNFEAQINQSRSVSQSQYIICDWYERQTRGTGRERGGTLGSHLRVPLATTVARACGTCLLDAQALWGTPCGVPGRR